MVTAVIAPLPNQLCSQDFLHDQFADGQRFCVLNVVDEATRECLASIPDTSIGKLVVRELDELIAIDGKTSRRSHDRAKGRAPLHTVSAWASRQRLVLGQEAVEEKSNEIIAIPLLLERLELTGALVTIDAKGT